MGWRGRIPIGPRFARRWAPLDEDGPTRPRMSSSAIRQLATKTEPRQLGSTSRVVRYVLSIVRASCAITRSRWRGSSLGAAPIPAAASAPAGGLMVRNSIEAMVGSGTDASDDDPAAKRTAPGHHSSSPARSGHVGTGYAGYDADLEAFYTTKP